MGSEMILVLMRVRPFVFASWIFLGFIRSLLDAERMVHVAFRATKAPGVEDAAEVRSPGDDKNKLVPVAGLGVSPRQFM